eukprot:1149255-Pelagomonas_calceolata.AAC.2
MAVQHCCAVAGGKRSPDLCKRAAESDSLAGLPGLQKTTDHQVHALTAHCSLGMHTHGSLDQLHICFTRWTPRGASRQLPEKPRSLQRTIERYATHCDRPEH